MRWEKVKIIKIGASSALAFALAVWMGNKFFVSGTFVVDPEAKEEIALLPEKFGQIISKVKNPSLPEFPYIKLPLLPPPALPPAEEPPEPTATPHPGFLPNPTATPDPGLLPNPTNTPWPTDTPGPGASPTPTRIPTTAPTATPPPVFTPTPTHYNVSVESFAQCLTQRGMKMYGTNTCGNCQTQKNMFGSAFSYINFIDCNQQPQVCNSEGVTGYPTWKDSAGRKYVGTQSFSSLSQISGCPAPN